MIFQIWITFGQTGKSIMLQAKYKKSTWHVDIKENMKFRAEGTC